MSQRVNDARDIFGTQINVGDKVLFMNIGYRNFTVGEVKKVSAKKVQLAYLTRMDFGAYKNTNQTHDQVVVLNQDQIDRLIANTFQPMM